MNMAYNLSNRTRLTLLFCVMSILSLCFAFSRWSVWTWWYVLYRSTQHFTNPVARSLCYRYIWCKLLQSTRRKRWWYHN